MSNLNSSAVTPANASFDDFDGTEPEHAVLYVRHPVYGWMPTLSDDLPDSLAARLIVSWRDISPAELDRLQALAGITWDDAEQQKGATP